MNYYELDNQVKEIMALYEQGLTEAVDMETGEVFNLSEKLESLEMEKEQKNQESGPLRQEQRHVYRRAESREKADHGRNCPHGKARRRREGLLEGNHRGQRHKGPAVCYQLPQNQVYKYFGP